MAEALILRARQGDSLDLLLHREAGLGPADLSRVHDANPGLADHPIILPVGTAVIVPAAYTAAAATPRALVQLWG